MAEFSNAVLSRISRFLVPTTLVLFAVPFIALLFDAVPVSDDFCKATLSFQCVPQPSILHITWLYYTQWTPRWFTTIIESFAMNHFNLVSSYGWLLLLVMLSNLAGLWYFFRTFFRLRRSTSLLVAGVFYFAWVASLPNPEEEIFWLTGALEYFLSISTLLVLLSLLYKSRSSIWYYVLVALLAIAIPAQHEIAGTLLCTALLAGAIYATIERQQALRWYLAFCLATASQLVLILSPGNHVRAAQEHRHLWDIAHLPKWAAHSFYHGLDWLSYPSILLAAFCILLLAQRGREKSEEDAPPPKWIAIAALCGMFVILCEYCLVEMASGSWSPERVVAWFAFIFCLFFVCIVLAGASELYRVQFSLATRVGVYVLFAVSLLGSANFRAAVEDLRGPAPSWHRLAATQLKQRTGGTVEFLVPTQYPKLAMHEPITADPGCWANQCLANYMHASSVVGKNSSEECPH